MKQAKAGIKKIVNHISTGTQYKGIQYRKKPTIVTSQRTKCWTVPIPKHTPPTINNLLDICIVFSLIVNAAYIFSFAYLSRTTAYFYFTTLHRYLGRLI